MDTTFHLLKTLERISFTLGVTLTKHSKRQDRKFKNNVKLFQKCCPITEIKKKKS